MFTRATLLLGLLGCAAAAMTAEMQQVLDKHNIYRCMHGVPLFVWDDAIAASAQAWADKGDFGPSPIAQRTVNGELCGENLAWGSPKMSGSFATSGWYSGIGFTSPRGIADNLTDSTSPKKAIGHYTQLVWRQSTRLGCGKGKVAGRNGDYWVCQYGQAGNSAGQFAENVLAPSKTEAQCGARWSSSCTPSPLLPHGGLCVFGYQCQSKVCCPRLRVCLASGNVSADEIQVHEEVRSTILPVILSGTCDNPTSQPERCMQTDDGQPLAAWDQASCGCKPEYMARHAAGTWLSLNDLPGLACHPGGMRTVLESFSPRAAGWLAASLSLFVMIFLSP